jgi:coiled-coil domain-containing protein 55
MLSKMKRQRIPADFGDLSSAVTARKNAQAAEELDPSIYDYDGAYDSFKPQKQKSKEDIERRPKYLGGLVAAAKLRDRDRLIAEEKKIAREREAEGDEFAGTEKFVTEAYKKQQEENRRLQEEEARREEEEARKNKNGGMTGFYKELLEKEDRRNAEMVKAAQERQKNGQLDAPPDDAQEERTEADIAREMNDKGGKVVVNEDGQVVDKRQLLKGGLNLGAKKKTSTEQDRSNRQGGPAQRSQGSGFIGAGGKQAMRERQSRMLEEQLEQSLKRARDEEAEEQRKVELAAKSRKTDSEVSSAKERYLARKKAAEEEKRKHSAG